MSRLTQSFYDDLAEDYHLLFADWQASLAHQGQVLAQFLQSMGVPPPSPVLDCACGIGTQALGLALQGYRVQGSDLSPKAIERARREAQRLGVEIPFHAADFRELGKVFQEPFPLVIACDNALPHMLSAEAIRESLRCIAEVLEPGGLFLASIRDYDALLLEKPQTTSPRLRGEGDKRYFSFQEWQWQEDEPIYTFNHFVVQQRQGEWHTSCRTAKYWAIQRAELSELLEQAGFVYPRWHMPEETGYYQPIVTAKKEAKQ